MATVGYAPPGDALAVASKAMRSPSFLAFSSVLHVRLAAGRSHWVQVALQDIGSPPSVAYGIIEGWPVQPSDRRLRLLDLSMSQEGACWLARFIDDIDRYDWNEVLADSVG